MLDLMNDINKEGLMIKYYLDEGDAIMARITYMVPNEEFDANFCQFNYCWLQYYSQQPLSTNNETSMVIDRKISRNS